jgi:hypothetical protein
LQRFVVDVKMPVEPVEAGVEVLGGFQKKPRACVKPKPDGGEEGGQEPK